MDIVKSPSEEEKKPPTTFQRLLINRNYAYNWIGLATSRLGNVIFKISLILWVATTLARNAPWAPLALGGLVFLPTVVALLVGTVAGVYVDRWDCRRTQLFMDAARAVIFTLLVIAITIVPLFFPVGSDAANLFQLACVYIVVMLNSACDPFVNSSLAVLLYSIVDEPDLDRAFGRGQVLNNLGTILGPPLGAAIFFALGMQWSIILDILSFVVSFFAFFMVRLPPKPVTAQEGEEAETKKKTGFRREFTEGLRFALGNKLLVAIVLAMMLNAVGAAGIGIFDLFFATNNLHAIPQVYAYLDVVVGIGAIIGAIFLGPWLRPRFGVVRVYWVAGVMNGVLLLLYSRLTNLTSAFIVMFLYGLSQAVFTVAFAPILFRAVPRGMMGRVNSILAQVLTTTSLVSVSFVPLLIAGPLRDKYLHFLGLLFGPVDILFTSVGILIITSGLYLRVTLNVYRTLLSRPPQPGQARNQLPQQDVQKPGRLSTLQKQIAIYSVGIAIAILIVVPVALTAPANAVATVPFSQGHPANGASVDTIPCQARLGTAVTANVHLTIYLNGVQVGIPAGIGSVAPPQPGVAALASNGKLACLYALHVFENDNIIHVDSPTSRTYTLGQFFAIWGQSLSQTQVANYTADTQHKLAFYVFDANGNVQNFSGDPGAITLSEHESIVITYNSPDASITPYYSWNGL